jgi:photosystem II stability/assembly factor-like uncharacterized protein
MHYKLKKSNGSKQPLSSNPLGAPNAYSMKGASMKKLFVFFIMCSTLFSTLGAQTFWKKTNFPYSLLSLTTFAINSKGHILAETLRSTDNGETWVEVSYPGDATTAMTVTPEDNFLLGGYGHLYMSTNEGNTWSNKANITDYNGNSYRVLTFAVQPDSIIWAGTAGRGIWGSDNLGYSWFGGQAVLGLDNIRILATNSQNHLFAVAVSNSYLYENNINNSAWDGIKMFPSDIQAVLTVDPSYIFVATSKHGIYRSTDNGGSFDSSNAGLNRRTIVTIASNADGNLFVGTDSAGVFRSTDHGMSWEAINDGLTDIIISGLYGHGNLTVSPNGYLFLSTYSGGVFRSTYSTITSVSTNAYQFPKTFALQQNYPNPFNPSTNIPFRIPLRTYVSLKIFDLLGREVANLASGQMEPGDHSVHWDASAMSSGTYFYRLQSGTFVDTKKLLLIK